MLVIAAGQEWVRVVPRRGGRRGSEGCRSRSVSSTVQSQHGVIGCTIKLEKSTLYPVG
jgi:hypothetical protein